MRRSSGPTAMVIRFASLQPGGVISWLEAKQSYAHGTVKGYDGPRPAAAHHKMSISNVLRRHFIPVEGARGLYVLKSMTSNPNWEEDMDALRAFQDSYDTDEFGMSVRLKAAALVNAIDSIASSVKAGASYKFQRMSDIA